MTLATHSTQAPAARKRGGGPAHIHQVNAMTIGRQPLPEGGEIKSLCRAAAGIIHTLSANTEARVYPTDRVRGAQKMEPRSANHPSPAAQPVKGYKRPQLPKADRTFPTRRTLETLARAFYGLQPSDDSQARCSAAHCRRLRLLDPLNALTDLGLQVLCTHANEPRHRAGRAAA